MAYAVAGMLAATISVPALGFAENNKDKNKNEVKAEITVKIGVKGDVMLKNAKVTAVNGTTLTLATVWPNATLSWNVATDANTKIEARGNGRTTLSSVLVGDMVDVQGSLTGASPLSFRADKLMLLKKVPAEARMTIQGTLVSLAGTTLPTSLVLRVGGVDYTVRIATDAVILNSIWLRTSLVNFRINDTVRVYGLVDANAHTVDATVVRDASLF